MRKIVFANDECYHIYNRGVDKRDVFLDDNEYVRFLKNLREFNSNLIREERMRSSERLSEFDSEGPESNSGESGGRFVDIIAYCLNPNHYHLILKQISEKGIEKFMQKVGTGYTNYFNIKNERSGALFQGKFKAIHVDSNEYLLYLSAYVNRNNFIHNLTREGEEWKYCSALDYLGKRNGTLCKKDMILGQFSKKSEFDSEDFVEYEKFMNVNAAYLKEEKNAAKYRLEE